MDSKTYINNITWAIFGTIVLANARSIDIVPKDILIDIKINRLLELLKNKGKPDEKANLPEIVAYLMTLSLEQPLNSLGTTLYCFACTQYAKQRKIDVPQDIKVETLTAYEKEEYDRLARWIREKSLKRWQEYIRSKNKEIKETRQIRQTSLLERKEVTA